MNIELSDGQAAAELSRDELRLYGVSFRSMSLSDRPTRVLLDDIMRLAEHMGWRTCPGGITVECARSRRGGCVIVISPRGGAALYFASSDDVAAAAAAGALRDGELELFPSHGGYIARPDALPEGNRMLLLGEFAQIIEPS